MKEQDVLIIDVDNEDNAIKKSKKDCVNELTELYDDCDINALEDLAEEYSNRGEIWKEDNPEMAHQFFELQKLANHYIHLYYEEYELGNNFIEGATVLDNDNDF